MNLNTDTPGTSSEESMKANAYYDNGDDDEDFHLAKRSRKEEILWTEPREYILASLFKAKKAYMKTKNMKMEDKKLMVLNEIRCHPAFSGESSKLTVGGISAKFARMEQSVLVKYSLDAEGSNLSGLPENPTRVEELMYNMLKEKMETTVRSNQKKKKEADRAERLQSVQDQMLQNMVRPPAVPSSIIEPTSLQQALISSMIPN